MQTTAQPTIADLQHDALYRRVAWRLIPFLVICYACAIVDRLNIAMAKLQMLQALNFSEAVYGFGAGVFFLGYLLFDIPSNLILHRVGARWWIARIMITWGLVSVATAFVTTPLWFYALRFLLGAAEAGFFAGLVLYATYWFPLAWRGRIYAYMLLAVPLAGVVVGPLSGAIMTGLNGAGGLSGWQLLFILEGVPSVVLGFAVAYWLDSRIEDASWLNAAEKAQLQAGLDQTTPGPKSYGFAVSGIVWLMCIICFAISTGMYVVGFWAPTMIHAAGVDGNFTIGLYIAIPWLVAIVPLLWGGRNADRQGLRRIYVAAPLLVCGVALAVSTMGSGVMFALVTLTIATSGVLLALAQFWSLPTAYLTGVSAAGGIALINSIGNLAGFASPSIVGAIKQSTGSTDIGVLIMAGVIIVGSVLTMLIPAHLVEDGRKRPDAMPANATALPSTSSGAL
jgi:MFS family permease